MKDIDAISSKIDKKKEHLSQLFSKDEENYNLWAGKEQIFDSHKMAVNITGTEMVSLALRTQASLMRSRLDIHVLPPDNLPNPDAIETANREEDLYYYAFNMADERLSRIGEASLKASASWQSIVLGRIAARILVIEDDEGNIVFDFLPLNPRFLKFAFDSNGLSWAAYETFRSPDSIWEEYKVKVEDKDGKGISVIDYWDREHNVRFLTEGKQRLGKAWKHPFPQVPIIIEFVAGGPKAITSDGIQVTEWGQSIFDHVKMPFKKLNELKSIAATHAHLIAKAPLDVAFEGDMPNLEVESLDFYPGALLKHPNTYKIESMRIADIPQSLTAIIGDLAQGIKNATYTELNPDVPAHSGSALRILGQDKQDVENPRIGALNNFYTRVCKAVKCQVKTQKLTVPVRTVRNKAYEVYDMKPDMIDNDFYIQAEFVRQDVYDEVEALQRAQLMVQNQFMSREDAMERILNEKDVPTAIAKIRIEQVEDAVPEFKLKEAIKIFRQRGMDEEEKMAKKELAILELQKMQELRGMFGQETPATAPPTMPTARPATPMMPATPPGG